MRRIQAQKPAAKAAATPAAEEIKTGAPKAEPASAKKPAAKQTADKKTAPKKAAAKSAPKKPTALIIMDGFGHRDEVKGNAIKVAKTPNLDRIFSENPTVDIGASGLDVGLPDGQMGNSEVGHTNIGAGRIVYQELTRITKAIQDGTFFENEALRSAIDQCKWFNSTLHIFGLLSDGGVHSHIDHMFALLELARRSGLRKVCFHCFMDGRDTPPQSGIEYIDRLQAKINAVELGCIATISGRYYAMDRDNRWERVEKAYDAIVNGVGEHAASAHEAMQASYDAGVTDEFVVPVIVTEGATVQNDDAIIFANFRPDRAREITRAFVDDAFTGFARDKRNIHYVCMTQYDATIPGVEIAFKPQSLQNTFGEYISDKGLTQLRIAETEKYAHVTFFFNGGVEKEYPGEDRALIPSPKVATYDLQPEMSEPAVTEECVKRILSGKYDMIVLNFANCDMVGHTGVFDAAVKAIEAVDEGVGKVVDAILKMDGQCLLTADHGNVDQMLDADGVTPFTAHSTNPVPLAMIGHKGKLAEGGVLADIAPTLLAMMGLPQPEEMTGKSLLIV
ncbi:MAG: 2,3-bisphosphoglycerate-independent phosphoglycerate mutase [Agathobaculum sp.]|uniref:2,3-bisphosphoglycerate-independent phosphoglycerate mutase n=1 Tax=Agathobaculum sp. TaxID=2048138 RepID=UPI0025C6FE9B|nr:2,3-bisphosphoglycerate-independent phosphoglycerate mutase [Agathobaculum sp.]MDY3712315.1 2,3-bisphosphoglycerate-independent phosphoglycerate mutase [Agathobaculum sp.]